MCIYIYMHIIHECGWNDVLMFRSLAGPDGEAASVLKPVKNTISSASSIEIVDCIFSRQYTVWQNPIPPVRHW